MRLDCDDRGPRDATVILLLHGFPLDRTMWTHQIGPLADSGRRVVVPDLRGFGRTGTPPCHQPGDAFVVDQMADDLWDTLDALGIGPARPVTLAGLSMGGYVALAAAVQRPERVAALILLNTRDSADDPAQAAQRLELAAAIETSGSTASLVESMPLRLLGATTQAQQPHLLDQVRAMMSAAPPLSVAATLRGLAARPDRTNWTPTWTKPACVIVGNEDVVSPPEVMHALADRLRLAPEDRVAIPQAGHLTPLEQPQAVTQALLAFLDRLDQPE